VATYTAHITAGNVEASGGVVTFTNDGHVMCKAPVKAGIATCTSRLATKAAVLTIAARYSGSPGFSASVTAVGLKVYKAPDAITLSRKVLTPGIYRYVAYIRPVTKIGGAGVPRGSVTFESAKGTICSARLLNEIASCISSSDPVHYLAIYHPGKDFKPSIKAHKHKS